MISWRAVVVFVASLAIMGQPRAQFWRQYSAGDSAQCSGIAPMPGGGYVMLGGWSIRDTQIHEDIVMKVDDFGNPIWSYLYESTDDVNLSVIDVSPDGTIGAAGTNERRDGTRELVFLRLDSDGNVLSLRSLETARLTPEGIAACEDGSFVICTARRLFKVGADGTLLWARSYQNVSMMDVIERADGTLATVGAGRSTSGASGAHVIVWTPTGEVAWQVLHVAPPGRTCGLFSNLAELASGDLVVAATATSPVGTCLWVSRLSPEDGVAWSRCIHGLGNNQPVGIQALSDGSIAAVAHGEWASHLSNGHRGPYGAGLSADGDLEWLRVVPSGSIWATTASPTGGLVMAGSAYANADLDAWIAQLGLDGWLLGSCPGMYDASAAIEWAPTCIEPPQAVTSINLASASRDIDYTRRTGPVPSTCARPCLVMDCNAIVMDPGSGPGNVGLRLEHDGGYGVVTVSWDLDGDTAPDATGNPAWVALPAGPRTVTARAVDSCSNPDPSTCMTTGTIDVVSVVLPVLTEVSDVLAGAPPLQVTTDELRFSEVPGADAYHVYVDRIGSWYEPSDANGRTCYRRDARTNGDGTVALAHVLPSNSWVEVTAADGCQEGPTGRDSFGNLRSDSPSWSSCGSWP